MRGKERKIDLKRSFILNENTIRRAVINLDHINYGIDKKTRQLNKNKRSNFTVGDIEKFLMLLDGEYIAPESHRGRISRFVHRIDCPVAGRFYGKEFIVYETDFDKDDEIYTVTLFPGWRI